MNSERREDLTDRLCWVLVVAYAAVVYCLTSHI